LRDEPRRHVVREGDGTTGQQYPGPGSGPAGTWFGRAPISCRRTAPAGHTSRSAKPDQGPARRPSQRPHPSVAAARVGRWPCAHVLGAVPKRGCTQLAGQRRLRPADTAGPAGAGIGASRLTTGVFSVIPSVRYWRRAGPGSCHASRWVSRVPVANTWSKWSAPSACGPGPPGRPLPAAASADGDARGVGQLPAPPRCPHH